MQSVSSICARAVSVRRNVCVWPLSADLSAGRAYQALCSSKAVKSDAVGSVVAKTILFVTVFGNEGEICYGFAYVFSKLVNTAGMRN